MTKPAIDQTRAVSEDDPADRIYKAERRYNDLHRACSNVSATHYLNIARAAHAVADAYRDARTRRGYLVATIYDGLARSHEAAARRHTAIHASRQGNSTSTPLENR